MSHQQISKKKNSVNNYISREFKWLKIKNIRTKIEIFEEYNDARHIYNIIKERKEQKYQINTNNVHRSFVPYSS